MDDANRYRAQYSQPVRALLGPLPPGREPAVDAAAAKEVRAPSPAAGAPPGRHAPPTMPCDRIRAIRWQHAIDTLVGRYGHKPSQR